MGFRMEKISPKLPDPVPVNLGKQQAERVLDLNGLFQVYLVRYVTTPPRPLVESYIAKSGTPALVLFTKDEQTFLASLIHGKKVFAESVERDWLIRLLEVLAEKGPADAVEWAKSALEAHKELQSARKKRPYRNQGLFSDHYLDNRLRESEEWQGDYESARRELLELWKSKESLLQGANEAQTEYEFIQPVLERLGFACWVQDFNKTAALRPDYVLYPDEVVKKQALRDKKDETKRYAPALAIAEAKYYGRNLDVKRQDARDRVHSSVSPSFQLSEYLSVTGVEWGILTNGLEWRLYWGRATDRQKRYYAVNLEEALQDAEAFKFFWLFFRREAFVEGAHGSFLRRLLEGSQQYGLRVGTRLKEVVFEEVFPKLAEGFLQYHQEELKQSIEGNVLLETYRATLTLLYRLLFLLYAEDRDLLPLSDTLGYYHYSLSRIRREVAEGLDKGLSFSKKAYTLWERLTTLFGFIDTGDPSLKVPPYNGGLFRPDAHPFLKTHKVADAYLGPALDRLARQPDENGTLRFVDYKYLTVRELGAVYEGLLEFRLEISNEDLVVVRENGREVYKPKRELAAKEEVIAEVAKGKPYLVNDKSERHATGSYYTPDYIVKYIVSRTLEPVVEQRREALRRVLEEYKQLSAFQDKNPSEDHESRLKKLRHKALETLLEVKVVDPAMGSGHFLVAAVDFLSERFANLITELQAEPVLDALGELRDEIRSQMQQFGLALSDEQLSDINLLKRMVMKRCVFGVDLNPMAVELAKLSLWLDAFTVGAPLSFLDHHLRCGNSVLGISRKQFEEWVQKENSVWSCEIKREVEAAIQKAQELLEVHDLTPDQVKLSQRLYQEAEATLTPLRRALDIYAAGLFAEKSRNNQFLLIARIHLPTLSLSTLSNPPSKHHLPEAIGFARERHLFHWEFEFPEVFFSPERKDNPGFDAVIGNPPYVRQEQLGPNKRFFEQVYPEVYAGKADLYAYFFARGLGLLRKGGRLGFISSRQFTRAEYGKGLRKLLTDHALREVIDFGENPVFEGVGAFPGIFVVEKAAPAYPIRFKAVNKAEFTQLMKAPAEARSEALARLAESGQDLGEEAFHPEGWTLGSAEKNAILQKMRANGVPLEKYVKDIYLGIKTGLNEAFFIDEATRNRLIQDNPESAELIKPLLVGDDVRHYYVRWPNDPQTQYLLFVRQGTNIEDYPAVKRHLEKFKDRLEPKPDGWKDGIDGEWRGRKSSNHEWYEIQSTVNYYKLFEGPKIVYPDIAKEPRFYLDLEGFYLANTVYFLPTDNWFLLAVLNSRVFFWMARQVLNVLGQADEKGRLRFFATHLKKLYLPEAQTTAKDIAKLDIPHLLNDESNFYKESLAWAEGELSAGRRDTVAAFLGFLAQEMQRMQAERFSLEDIWRNWVLHEFDRAEQLGKEWLLEGWVQEGLDKGIEAITKRFKVKKVPTTPRKLSDLKRITQETLNQLRPLYQRIRATDELIDRLVARLYGLTDEEVEWLWAASSS